MNFHPASRVWIYMSDREFTDVESGDINRSLKHFCREWTAHGADLHAHGEVRFNRFILLMVDETIAGASGCSIDKSVHFIKELEREYGVQLFNRLLFAWKKGTQIHVSPLHDLQQLFDAHEISEETIVFNNAVTGKQELDEKWMLPLKDSWMYTRINKKTVKV